MEKLVLAYSGGLDTSYCVAYLKEQGYEVHAATVNTGSFSQEELRGIEERAFQLGVSSFEVLEETRSYYEKCVRYLLYGNILKNHTYPLSVSAERMFQALAIAQYAKKLNANAIAHGSTGAGNDQVRFDLAFQILMPQAKIITPIRDQKLSREEEVKFLQERGVNISMEKAQYSINKGLWGTSVGGKETLNSWDSLPEEAYPTQLGTKGYLETVLHFDKGEFIGIDEQRFDHPVAAIEALDELAKPYAIGRDTHVGDTIIGIKGRVGFEAAAPLILIKAHQLMEKHVLSKWQMHWKDQLANWYGMLLHEGQFLEPVMRNIEGFLTDTQKTVSGKVRVRLSPYRFDILGIESPHDLMASKFGTYGEMNRAWSGEDVKGFTKILSNSHNIYYQVNEDLMDLNANKSENE
ncbi:MAG: argininosuccinate synthase [Bacteroidia bacterium]|nr:argininosuccinate synthase [Bacteroidia bacterium]